MSFKQKPLALACYLCGREFGTKSLQIHLKSCKEKFQLAQNLKEKKDRIVLPQEPLELQEIINGNLQNIQKYNQLATHIHKYSVLPSCKYCKRTFNEQSLKTHENVCPKKNNDVKKVNKPQNIQSKDDSMKKPRTLVCCVCGREFGLTSLRIHYSQCVMKFKNEQKLNPVEERRQPAIFSEQKLYLLNTKEDWSIQQIQAFNAKASQGFKDKGMIHCANCKRAFMPQPYQRHLKNCKLINGNNIAPIEKSKEDFAKKQEQIKKPRILVCCVCGRQFGLSSLKIHYPQCLAKFKNEQKAKAKQDRLDPQVFSPEELDMISTKEDWTSDQIQTFNKRASLGFKDKGMIHCANCKRAFMPDPYQRHLKNCKLINGNNQEAPTIKDQKKIQQQIKKPKVLMCHICGRQFGLSSLLIHQKACRTKFINNENLKAKSQQKDLPEIPLTILDKFDFNKIQQWQSQTIDQYNKIANEVYRNESMYECPFCLRKFKQESFEKHRNYCQKHNKKTQDKQQLGKISQTQDIAKNRKDKMVQKQHKITNSKQKQIQKTINLSKVFEEPSELQETTEIKAVQWKKESFFNKIKQNNLTQNQSLMKVDQMDEQIQKKPKQQSNMKIESKKKSQSPKKTVKVVEKDTKALNKNQQSKIQQNRKEKCQQTDLQKQHLNSLEMCKLCLRKFVPERLSKHQSICKGAKKTIHLPEKKIIDLPQKKITNLPEKKAINIPEKTIDLPEKKAIQNNQKPLQKESSSTKIYNEPTMQQNQFLNQKLIPCQKCGRKFNQDRLQVHQNACKGIQKRQKTLKQKIKEEQSLKKAEIVRKTKQNFFKMAEQLKSKRIKEQQIDNQLQLQLEKISNIENKTPRLFKNKKQNNGRIQQLRINKIQKSQQIGRPGGVDTIQTISKWNKKKNQNNNMLKNDPKFEKNGRHLPKI